MSISLGGSLLEACVLAVLSREDTYGYILTQNIKQLTDISESTLYPVLRRLQKDDFLTTYDRSFNGRNRRFYQITNKGRELLSTHLTEWNEYKKNLDTILLGGNLNE